MKRNVTRHSRVGVIRAYGMALGFALGQVGSVLPGTVRPRPAIVRDVDQAAGPDGFHPLERLDDATVLTLPLIPRGETGGTPERLPRRYELN